MLRKYLNTLIFFTGVSLSWLSAFTGGVYVDPTIERTNPFKSLGYSFLTLVLWIGLLVGGLALEMSLYEDQPMLDVAVLLVWGFMIVPIIAVAIMRLLFPKLSESLRIELEQELANSRKQRQDRKKKKK